MCKYCNPNDEIKKNNHWEHLDLNDFETRSSAYIVPADKYNRACLVVQSKEINMVVADIVLNYCPMCGAKLPE